MMLLMVAAEIAAANVADAQRSALEAYQSCVLAKAAEFHHKDLSGDSPSTVAHAAAFTCDKERSDLVEKTKTFVRERHPGLGPGSVGKVTALFVVKQEADLEQAVEAQIIREANAPNN